MIDSLETLLDTIAAETGSGRIGRPVSVRGLVEMYPDHGQLLALLARLACRASHWLDDPPARLYASGSVESGHVTALLEGRGGTTALLTGGVLRAGSPFVDLLIVGSRGTLHHEGGIAASHLEIPEAAALPGDLTAVERRLLEGLGRSLESGGPVDVGAREEER